MRQKGHLNMHHMLLVGFGTPKGEPNLYWLLCGSHQSRASIRQQRNPSLERVRGGEARVMWLDQVDTLRYSDSEHASAGDSWSALSSSNIQDWSSACSSSSSDISWSISAMQPGFIGELAGNCWSSGASSGETLSSSSVSSPGKFLRGKGSLVQISGRAVLLQH